MAEVEVETVSKQKTETKQIDLTTIDFHPLIDALGICGLDTKESNVLTGKSGVRHSFAIIANYRENEQRPVVVDIVLGSVAAGISYVISLFAKAVDCRVKHSVLVAVPGLDDDARALARSFNIHYVEELEPQMPNIAEKLKLKFKLTVNPRTEPQGTDGGSKAGIDPPARTHIPKLRKRNSLDIMSDILKVVGSPSSKTEIMACANLSYDQCVNYVDILGRLGFLREYFEDGIRSRFTITEKGQEYLSNLSPEFGRIEEGDKSVWSSRRRSQRLETAS